MRWRKIGDHEYEAHGKRHYFHCKQRQAGWVVAYRIGDGALKIFGIKDRLADCKDLADQVDADG